MARGKSLIPPTSLSQRERLPLFAKSIGELQNIGFASQPEAFADLKDPGVACGQQSLYAQFRGRLKKSAACADCIDVKLRGRCRNQVGSVNFEIVPLNKKMPYGLDHSRPRVA